MPLLNRCGGGGVDASGVTANASQILEGTTIIDAEGNPIDGTMPDNGAVNITLDTSTTSKNIAKGYHNGSGKASITLETKTVTPTTSKQIITPTSGKVLSEVTINAMNTATQATPTISVSSSGLITASATQSAGYVNAGTKSATKQLATKSTATYTPSTSNQTISSGTYLTGTQTIKGDSNLIASNIKSGVSIFGVPGELVEGYKIVYLSCSPTSVFNNSFYNHTWTISNSNLTEEPKDFWLMGPLTQLGYVIAIRRIDNITGYYTTSWTTGTSTPYITVSFETGKLTVNLMSTTIPIATNFEWSGYAFI